MDKYSLFMNWIIVAIAVASNSEEVYVVENAYPFNYRGGVSRMEHYNWDKKGAEDNE